MKKALLVIDMQNVCVGEKHAAFFKYNNRDLIQEVNKVVDANEKNLVVYIKNVMKKSLLNKFAPFIQNMKEMPLLIVHFVLS